MDLAKWPQTATSTTKLLILYYSTQFVWTRLVRLVRLVRSAQQRCLEFQNLLTSAPQVLSDVFPVDASCEDVEADSSLSIMNSHVQEALARGAVAYCPPPDDDDEDEDERNEKVSKQPAFNITAYAKPVPNHAKQMLQPANNNSNSNNNNNNNYNNNGQQAKPSQAGLRMGDVPAVWGPALVESQPENDNNNDNAADQQQREEEEASKFQADMQQAIEASAAESNVDIIQAAPYESKVVELTEKEKMAAALFGGISTRAGGGGQTAANRRNRNSNINSNHPTPAPVSAPVFAPVITPAPAPAPPVPAPLTPSMDLLDMGFDVSPPPPPNSNSNNPPTSLLDPFGSMSMEPATTNNSTFSHNNENIHPHNINTQTFGGCWGKGTNQTSTAISTPVDFSLESLAAKMIHGGFAVVETIAATNETICAGTFGDSGAVILLHSKFTSGKMRADVTLKWIGVGGAGVGAGAGKGESALKACVEFLKLKLET